MIGKRMHLIILQTLLFAKKKSLAKNYFISLFLFASVIIIIIILILGKLVWVELENVIF